MPQDRCLAADGHLARPFPVYPQAKAASGSKRQIDQFDAQSLFGFEIGNDHAVVRFGARHTPFYKSNRQDASDKSKIIVHGKKYSAVHTIASTIC